MIHLGPFGLGNPRSGRPLARQACWSTTASLRVQAPPVQSLPTTILPRLMPRH